MPKSLERDLGLISVLAISIGAMIGSGIFILPAVAVGYAGPAVVLAYVLAGIVVLPAALSKSEMATAMPESGGTYIFIERGMGPLLGTVAGIGTWFSLSFKGGLALVGGVPYLLYLFDVPPTITTPLALTLAVILVLVNLLGAKQTGRVQVVIVAVMLAALGWFAVGGTPSVQPANYAGFFESGIGGILTATGLVFVSYAGVTKVASVAEEVENPERNIPLGILGSLGFTTALYALIVIVMLGVTDTSAIAASDAPMAVAAEAALGPAGVAAVVVAALLALVSTANAGILSSSRYPFAMSRDNLVPPSLGQISDRFNTPSASITLTGVVLLLLIAFVPLESIAKLASAFQILVFVLVNFAVVAFRRGSMEYEPTFEAPLYPWMQGFGVVGGLLLLTQMGTIPLLGAVLITAGSVAWYFWYARDRVEREGAAVDAVRRELGKQAVERTRTAVSPTGESYEALVAVPEDVDPSHEAALVDVAADLAAPQHGQVSVVRFDEVADQVPLEAAAEQSPADIEFEERTGTLATDVNVPVHVSEVVSHDTRHALAHHVTETGVDTLVMEREAGGLRDRLFGSDADWVLEHTDCDAVLVDDDGEGLGTVDTVAVITDEGPYDPAKIAIADAIATAHDAEVTLEYAVEEFASEEQQRTITDYHEEVAQLCSAPVRTGVVADGGTTPLESRAADVLVVSTEGQRLVADADCPALVVRPREATKPGWLGRVLERWLL
ncbi:universal stress protein [Halococcus saccharolyticus]|uniref:Amino acid permease n=1 Tax=Halococcus saccharolyticus DSM 5350 TaxID=1227455 RepID=M0MS06_9EURY|nr:amino acid permease [Halococcus saccharolyticus]EMA47250.1 amino acid permease [Halococcus saccharolyticus DSM 5350]